MSTTNTPIPTTPTQITNKTTVILRKIPPEDDSFLEILHICRISENEVSLVISLVLIMHSLLVSGWFTGDAGVLV